MSSASPGVRRVVAILNFIADHPEQSFTLTDLVRALRLSRATSHSLLTGLVEAGYLYRGSDKSYMLGPALAALGEIAKTHFSPMQVAQPEMRALADEYDAICAACVREGSDAVIRERTAALSHVGQSTPRGAKLPLLAQLASVFFVWSSPEEVDQWLDNLDPPPSPEQREMMLRGIEVIRGRGFGVGVRKGEWHGRISPLGRQAAWDMLDQTMSPLFDVDPDTEYDLGSLHAPVYDSRKKVVFVLALSGFKGPCRGRDLEDIGRHLVDTCDRMSSFIGRIPVDAV